MAFLIPPYIPQLASSGERKLFYRLREDPLAKDWSVFHSLQIKKHINQIEGEIDLIIAIPGMAILCIEIKACEVKRENGIWHYSYGTSAKGPFRQVSDSMHSLRNWIIENDSDFNLIPFFSAVIFTEVNFREQSPEWHPWQFLNHEDITNHSVAKLLLNIYKNFYSLIKGKKNWYDQEKSHLSNKQIKKFSELLRGNFIYKYDSKKISNEANLSIKRMTEEQVAIANQYDDNDRMLIKGPAGTGKTYIAIDAANWAINNNKSILFLCFNRLLANWLDSETFDIKNTAKEKGVDFYVGTFHKLLQDITEINISSEANNPDFWTEDFPALALNKIINSPYKVYDFLIIDEGQDLLEDNYLDVLDILLNKGISKGKWLILGDFERQAIYRGSSEFDLTNFNFSSINNRCSTYSTFNLRSNCRNLKDIADSVTLISALQPGYKKVINDSIQGKVEPYFYGPESEQLHLLENSIERLKKEFSNDQIVILTMGSLNLSCAEKLAHQKNIKLVKFGDSETLSNDVIRYTSIRLFKGLEAAAVIITDINDLSDFNSKSLLYIGMSRAKINLTMLLHSSLKKTYTDLILSGLQVSS